MYNYKSVRSSEPQIRSNPALRHVSPHSGFQKRISALLEPTPLPFPTFQLVKETSQNALEMFPHYAWVRPAHLRSQWVVLSDSMPLLMCDPRNPGRMFSLRIPFDKRRVEELGCVVCEGAWDAQNHILYLWDVVLWDREIVWETQSYSKRWSFLKEIVGEILDCGHPMSDAEVRLPVWESLEQLADRQDLDPATSIDFQPEKAAQRRRVFLVSDEGVKFRPTTHAERKMVADQPSVVKTSVEPSVVKTSVEPSVVKTSVEPSRVKTPIIKSPVIEPTVQEPIVQQPVERPTIARLSKDASKMPDTYRLTGLEGANLGLAAIRSMEMSKRLRELIKTNPQLLVEILWIEAFQKYEVKKVFVNLE